MTARSILLAALAFATIGMVVVVLAVIVPGLFYVGIYLIDAAALALAVAGVLHLRETASA